MVSIFLGSMVTEQMQEGSKILLSKKELEVLAEVEFFHLKKTVTEKIFGQLASLVQRLQMEPSFLRIAFPPGTDVSTGKISKGENYLGMPFIMLDFPKKFSEGNVFAFRTMAWWGNFISSTLLLSGKESLLAKKKLIRHFSSLAKNDIFLCINESPWHHHFGEENYLPLHGMSKKEVEKELHQREFLKVSRKIPVKEINRLQEFSLESFKVFSRLLT